VGHGERRGRKHAHFEKAGLLYLANMFVDPFEDWFEAELASFEGLNHEVASCDWRHFEVVAIDQEKSVGSGKRDSFVAVEERVIVR